MIFDFIKSIFEPAEKIIDNVTTTDEERLTLKNELEKIQNVVTSKWIEFQYDIIKNETNSTQWLASNWRPLTMLSFVLLIVLSQLGIISKPVSPDLMELIKLGLTGYVAGRSVEKLFGKN